MVLNTNVNAVVVYCFGIRKFIKCTVVMRRKVKLIAVMILSAKTTQPEGKIHTNNRRVRSKDKIAMTRFCTPIRSMRRSAPNIMGTSSRALSVAASPITLTGSPNSSMKIGSNERTPSKSGSVKAKATTVSSKYWSLAINLITPRVLSEVSMVSAVRRSRKILSGISNKTTNAAAINPKKIWSLSNKP